MRESLGFTGVLLFGYPVQTEVSLGEIQTYWLLVGNKGI